MILDWELKNDIFSELNNNFDSIKRHTEHMIEKVVTRRKLQDSSQKADLAYWMSKTPEERIAQVEFLRRLYYGNSGRLQRVARVVKRKSS